MLKESDKDLIFNLAENLVGTCQSNSYRLDSLVFNVFQRIQMCECPDLESYIHYVEDHTEEMPHLVAALTVPTTGWFQDEKQFEALEKHLLENMPQLKDKKFRVCNMACSTGEEVYSLGLMLEGLRRRYPTFNYEIDARDINPLAIKEAKKGIYKTTRDSDRYIPNQFKKLLYQGSGKTEGLFALHPEIRKRCIFSISNILDLEKSASSKFDLIFCKNVLGYFSQSNKGKIINKCLAMLKPGGLFFVAPKEEFKANDYNMEEFSKAAYKKKGKKAKVVADEVKKVLVIDDSPTIRNMLSKLMTNSNFKPICLPSGEEATKFLEAQPVDLITLDLHMPGLDGIPWLKSQRSRGLKTPIIIISDAAETEAKPVLTALSTGAQDYINKGELKNGPEYLLNRFRGLLLPKKSKTYMTRNSRARQPPLKQIMPELIVTGASTGGTEALRQVFNRMPPNCPPIVVVQHITKAFAKTFADFLAMESGLILGQTEVETKLQKGHIYLAKSDYHIGLKRRGADLYVVKSTAAPVNRHRPSVDHLFRTTNMLKVETLAILLTGMGADGAKGLAELRANGAQTLVQDESSCVVFGMPKEAILLGAASYIGDLEEIRSQINRVLGATGSSSKSNAA